MVYKKKSVSFTNVLGALLASFVFMFILWQDFDARFLIIWVVNIAFAEVFVRLRWRMSVPCPHCAFDPLIYKKDPDQASELVKAQLARRREDPKYLLAQPLNLPRLTSRRAEEVHKQKELEAQRKGLVPVKRGQFVSKTL